VIHPTRGFRRRRRPTAGAAPDQGRSGEHGERPPSSAAAATGGPLGRRCPRLRRGGGWNPDHGTWYYQLELPAHADGTRRPRCASAASRLRPPPRPPSARPATCSPSPRPTTGRLPGGSPSPSPRPFARPASSRTPPGSAPRSGPGATRRCGRRRRGSGSRSGSPGGRSSGPHDEPDPRPATREKQGRLPGGVGPADHGHLRAVNPARTGFRLGCRE
jgi:hypothetical protein